MKYILVVAIVLNTIATFGQSLKVDPFTGNLNGSIPLGSVTSGNISVPIQLTYHTKGFKMTDGGGSAGMGWSLMAGGRITRDVRGLPDDDQSFGTPPLRSGWTIGTTAQTVNNYTPSGNTDYSVCSDENTDYNTLLGFGSTTDTEPDIFSIDVPGLTGQFVFDKDHNVVTIPYQDLKIDVTQYGYPDPQIFQFDVTTNEGIKYTFRKGTTVNRDIEIQRGMTSVSRFQTLYNQFKNSNTFTQSWELETITSPTGGRISFSYAYGNKSSSRNLYQEIKPVDTIKTIYTVYENIDGAKLRSITGANQYLVFNWAGDQISSIVFTENSYSQTKKFNFKYGFPGLHNNTNRRPFLTSLSEESNCNSFPDYAFEYHGVDLVANSTDLPFDQYKQQDHFGYYNVNGTSLRPNLYTKSGDTGTDGERYRFEPAPGYSLTAAGGSRDVNASTVYYGTLSKLILPAGGGYKVTYEPNSYYDATAGTSLLGAGARVKTLTTTSNDAASDITETYVYLASSGESSGQWLYRPMFAMADGSTAVRLIKNAAPTETIVYSRVDVTVTGAGKTTYEFAVPGIYPETSNGDFSAAFTRLARPSGNCSLGDVRMAGYYTYPFSVNTDYSFERGLPNIITEFDGSGKKVRKTLYTYQRTNAAAKNISGIRYEPMDGGYFVFSKYTLVGNVDKKPLTETVQIYDKSDVSNTKYLETVTTYSYNSNAMISQVSTTNSDNIALVKNFKYAVDYVSGTADTLAAAISNLKTNNRHGTLVETTTKNGTVYTGATLTLFSDYYDNVRMLPSQTLTLTDPTGFTPSTISSGLFTYSNKYIPSGYIDGYDDVGNITIGRNGSRTIASVIFGHNNTFPALEISNARADEVVYADFEPHTEMYPTSPTTINTTDFYAGRKSLDLNTGASVSKSVKKGAGRYYKFACWVKGATTSTLTIQINGGGAQTVNYSNPGSWQLLETRVDLSSVSGAFTFALVTSSNVTIDNLVFFPELASFVAHSYEPLHGKTADLDSRGGGKFIEYDDLGRVYRIRNRDRDVVKIMSYRAMRENSPPSLEIVGSTTPETGVSSPYTVDLGCLTGQSYQWYVDGSAVGTGGTLNYTFLENRRYQLKVSVSTNFGTVIDEITITPEAHVGLSLSLNGKSTQYDCLDTSRDITLNFSGCYDASNITLDWYQLPSTSTTPTHTLTSGIPPGGIRPFDVPDYGPHTSVAVWCVVNSRCLNLDTDIYENVTFTTDTINFIRRANTNCDGTGGPGGPK